MAKKIRAEKDKRTNDILLGPLERPALAFFAKHMPKWVNSDMLTVLGLLGSVLAVVAYALVGTGEVKANPWLFVASRERLQVSSLPGGSGRCIQGWDGGIGVRRRTQKAGFGVG